MGVIFHIDTPMHTRIPTDAHPHKHAHTSTPPAHYAGDFELSIDGGVSAYRDPRPQVVVLSSAGVERNAIVGDDAGAEDVAHVSAASTCHCACVCVQPRCCDALRMRSTMPLKNQPDALCDAVLRHLHCVDAALLAELAHRYPTTAAEARKQEMPIVRQNPGACAPHIVPGTVSNGACMWPICCPTVAWRF